MCTDFAYFMDDSVKMDIVGTLRFFYAFCTHYDFGINSNRVGPGMGSERGSI